MTEAIAKKQRNYDALLIRAFREDITTSKLYFWLKPYGIGLPDDELIRQPPPVKMRIRVFVASYLKPLADRLWDTERSEDIKTLNWMVKLKAERGGSRVLTNELSVAGRELKQLHGRGIIIKEKIYRDHLSNQWGVTKPNTRIRRIK